MVAGRWCATRRLESQRQSNHRHPHSRGHLLLHSPGGRLHFAHHRHRLHTLQDEHHAHLFGLTTRHRAESAAGGGYAEQHLSQRAHRHCSGQYQPGDMDCLRASSRSFDQRDRGRHHGCTRLGRPAGQPDLAPGRRKRHPGHRSRIVIAQSWVPTHGGHYAQPWWRHLRRSAIPDLRPSSPGQCRCGFRQLQPGHDLARPDHHHLWSRSRPNQSLVV